MKGGRPTGCELLGIGMNGKEWKGMEKTLDYYEGMINAFKEVIYQLSEDNEDTTAEDVIEGVLWILEDRIDDCKTEQEKILADMAEQARE